MRAWGGNLQHEISINEIIEQLQEYRQQSKAGEEAGQGGRDPVDVGPVAGPGEPEEADGEADGADHHGRQAPLGHGDVVVRRQLPLVVALGGEDVHAGEQHARDHAEEGEAADARVEAADLLEGDWVGCEGRGSQWGSSVGY